MAIVLNSSPSPNVSVNNEVLFVAYEATKANDEVTYPDYRYVADVYVSAVLVGRIKARPDPVNKRGIFDVSAILRSYVPAYGFNGTVAAKVDYDARLAYTVKFGEEYADTLYTNLLVDSERYVAKSYAVKPFLTTILLSNGKATNRPAIATAYKSELYHLVPYFSNVTGVTDVDLKGYTEAGSLVTNETISNSDFVANKIRQFNLSTATIRAASTVDYTVVTTPFSLRTNFICSRYPVITLVWLNPYGAYDSQQFGLVSKKSNEITRKSFSQLNYKIDASGVTSYQANNVFYGSKKGFASMIKVSMKLTSHLLSDLEYKWLAELFASTDVYVYDAVLVGFIPVSITDNNYEHRTYLNSRLKPLEFGIEFTDEYNAQYL